MQSVGGLVETGQAVYFPGLVFFIVHISRKNAKTCPTISKYLVAQLTTFCIDDCANLRCFRFAIHLLVFVVVSIRFADVDLLVMAVIYEPIETL